jgi:hypothetical protein
VLSVPVREHRLLLSAYIPPRRVSHLGKIAEPVAHV